MANKGKISVELSLALDKLFKQSKEAASILNINLAKGVGTTIAKDAEKATAAQEKLAKAVKQTTEQMKQQAKAAKDSALAAAKAEVEKFRAARESLNPSPMPKIMSPARQAELQLLRMQRAAGLRGYNAQDFFAGRIAGGNTGSGIAVPPTFNTVPQKPKLSYPPVVAPTPQFKVAPSAAAGQTFMQKIAGLRNAILPLGQILATLYLVKRAIDVVLTPLRMFANMLREAYENGRRMYANSVMSGMGLSASVKRSSLADALGVSEADIFQFGKQIEYLNERFEIANRVMVENATSMAAVSWEGSALMQSLRALAAQIAGAMAPVVQDFIESIRLFIETMLQSDVIVGLGNELAVVFQGLSTAFQMVLIAVNGFIVGIQVLADTLTYVMIKINNLLAKLPGAGKLGITHIDSSHAFDGSIKAAEGLKKQAEHVLEPYKNSKAPSPIAYMKQMPAAAWEKMGLQIGAGGGTNYAAQTAKNTSKTAALLEKVSGALTGNKPNITRPAGLPAGA